MAENYDNRIASAEAERRRAEAERDRLYPGSREWEDAHGKVQEWDSTIRELRRQQAS